MKEMVPASQSKCKKCYYSSRINQNEWACLYILRHKDDEERTRVVSEDGSLKYDPKYCDKFLDLKADHKKWILDVLAKS